MEVSPNYVVFALVTEHNELLNFLSVLALVVRRLLVCHYVQHRLHRRVSIIKDLYDQQKQIPSDCSARELIAQILLFDIDTSLCEFGRKVLIGVAFEFQGRAEIARNAVAVSL